MSKVKAIALGIAVTGAAFVAGVSLGFVITEPPVIPTPELSSTPVPFFIYELAPALFLNESRVVRVLDEGHSIIIIKTHDHVTGRPRLAAARQMTTQIEQLEPLWFQPALVYLMDAERIVITKTSKNQITVEGISLKNLMWMTRNAN